MAAPPLSPLERTERRRRSRERARRRRWLVVAAVLLAEAGIAAAVALTRGGGGGSGGGETRAAGTTSTARVTTTVRPPVRAPRRTVLVEHRAGALAAPLQDASGAATSSGVLLLGDLTAPDTSTGRSGTRQLPPPPGG